jgi:uncharacterized protein (TIGR00288 family)
LSPWWLRPTAEASQEEKNTPQESTPEPSPSAAEPPVTQATEPAPEPAWRSQSGDIAPAARPETSPNAGAGTGAPTEEPFLPRETPAPATWQDAAPANPQHYSFLDTEEPAAPLAESPVSPAEVAEGSGELQAGEAEAVGEDKEDKEEEKDEEGRPKRKRSRRSRRRKNGRGTATETAEATDGADLEEDDEEDDEPEALEEPAPPPPPPARHAPSHRRAAHAPSHQPPSPPAVPVALTPAPMQRALRSDSYVVPAGDFDAYTREIVISVPERQRSGNDERKIAMFCDLENVALGVRDSEISKFEIGLILERLLEKGKIIVKKAYADWERYSDYKRPFHEAAIELIDIPQKFYSGKNSADIKMVVDAMDLSYSKEHLDTFVIVSGDSDFSPLVSKLKENNKYVIGIGVKNSSSNLLIDNCDEFIYYEDVWRDNQKGPKLDGLNKKTAEAFSLMVESIQALIRENKDVLWGSMIKQTMQRKKPSFNEGYYGYSSFSELLEDAERKQILKLKKDQRSGTYIVTGFAKTEGGGRR